MFRLKDLRENLLTHIPVPKEINLTSKAVGNDLLIFLLTARKYPRFAYIQDVLNFFRVHKTSISVSSKRGELTFMYQLAETFFVEKYEISGQAFRKFNSKLFLSTIFFRHSLGITQIQEFYALKKIRLTNVSLRHILFLLILFMKRTIFKVR
jgi:hypothetical protein